MYFIQCTCNGCALFKYTQVNHRNEWSPVQNASRMKKKANRLMPFIIVVINCFRFLLLLFLRLCAFLFVFGHDVSL